jgi:hypothetical protein
VALGVGEAMFVGVGVAVIFTHEQQPNGGPNELHCRTSSAAQVGFAMQKPQVTAGQFARMVGHG